MYDVADFFLLQQRESNVACKHGCAHGSYITCITNGF